MATESKTLARWKREETFTQEWLMEWIMMMIFYYLFLQLVLLNEQLKSFKASTLRLCHQNLRYLLNYSYLPIYNTVCDVILLWTGIIKYL